MEESVYQVYCHANTQNGKKYIGATKNSWQERWKTKYRYNQHFYRAIMKYGEDAWEHIVIAEGLSREDASKLEKAVIAFFDTRNSDRGYNKGRGGEGITELESFYAKIQSREHREALSAAAKRRWASMDGAERGAAIARLRESALSSEELSAASRALWEDAEYRKKIQYAFERRREARERDPEYAEKREAAKEAKRQREKLYHATHYKKLDAEEVARRRASILRDYWSQPENRAKQSERMTERMSAPAEREKIRQKRLGTEQSRDVCAAISRGMSEKWRDAEFRQRVCKNRPPRTEEQKERVRETMSASYGRRVLCVETGVIFPSIAEAARSVDMDKKRFKKACAEQKTVKGFCWELLDDVEQAKRRVVCVETSKEYESVAEAHRETGISASGIVCVCKGARKSAGGFSWRYLS